jgi:hypothetical protein
LSGPGSDLSAAQWGAYLAEGSMTSYTSTLFYGQRRMIMASQRSLASTKLLIALALCQAEHAKPPAKLDELIPGYLTSLPLDPYHGRPFDYRISEGEEIENMGEASITLAPGQGLLSAESPPFIAPVPVWTK